MNTTINCHAQLKDNILTLETPLIRRRFHWNNGLLRSCDISDLRQNKTWTLNNDDSDFTLDAAQSLTAHDGQWQTDYYPAAPLTSAHLRVTVTCRIGHFYLRRVFRLYEHAAAIACDYYVKGQFPVISRQPNLPPQQLRNLENPNAIAGYNPQGIILDRLKTDQKHLELTAVRFYDITDRRNNLIETTTMLPYRAQDPLIGNILFICDHQHQRGLFWLKEAPCSDIQLDTPNEDFIVTFQECQLTGLGVPADAVNPNQWTRGYSTVIGVADDTHHQLQLSLRHYQNAARPYDPQRDDMILLNTWGDRNMDNSISADFARQEIDAAARLGITHFQLDDGWQKGTSPTSFKTQHDYHQYLTENDDCWLVHPDKFPNGLSPIVDYARQKNIELCLWFNPNISCSLRHWRRDADTLTRLYRDYGIRVFKIDGVDIPDKTAETNFRQMLDTVLEQTDHQTRFNLDITASRRCGYHYFYEYGNLFLENRYTDWANYHPHWTLRNLWQLAHYLPPQRLQIEFLNVFRNTDKYAPHDVTAPANVGFEFAFAAAIPAQPLAWFEASHLPDSAFEAAPLIQSYRDIQHDLHQHIIMPIGDCPNGFNWSGFQFFTPQTPHGYLLIYRQHSPSDQHTFHLRNLTPNDSLQFTPILGHGSAFKHTFEAANTTAPHPQQSITFTLPKPFSFALYHYTTI